MQVATVMLFAAALARVAYTQTVDPDGYSDQGLRQRLDTEVVPAPRGSILDRSGYELALSIPQQTVWADPSQVLDPGETARRVALVLDAVPGRQPLDVAGLAAQLADPTRHFTYVARQIDDATAAQVEALQLPGIALREEARRFLPSGTLAQSVIGATDVDGNGTAGMEQLWNHVLTGTPGEVVTERAPLDRTYPNGRHDEEPPVAGRDVVLTIDRTLQYEIEQLMLRAVMEAGARGGMAVVMDPRSGDVLAIVNVDRNADSVQVQLSLANKAMLDVFEPGSVNKMITMAAAVQEGVTAPETPWQVPAVLVYDDKPFRDHDRDRDRRMTARDILTESSNIGTFMIAEQLAPTRLYDYLAAFGLADRTPIGFPGESAGLLRPADEWYGTDKVTIPYGQGVAVTAMQMLGAYNAIANGGTYIPPRLMAGVVDPDGTRHDAPAPEARAVVSPETAAIIASMLSDVVNADAGTGERAAIPGYTVAGKTGTAKKPQGPDGYFDAQGDAHYMQVFAGFAPAENPRFSAIVVLDESQHAADGDDPIFGGAVAAPVFRELGKIALRHLHVTPVTAVDATAQPVAQAAIADDLAGDLAPNAGAASTDGESSDAPASDVGAGAGSPDVTVALTPSAGAAAPATDTP